MKTIVITTTMLSDINKCGVSAFIMCDADIVQTIKNVIQGNMDPHRASNSTYCIGGELSAEQLENSDLKIWPKRSEQTDDAAAIELFELLNANNSGAIVEAMLTHKRYTIILSAWQAAAPLSVNLENTDNFKRYVKYVLELDALEAVGHYKGGCEISFVIHSDDDADIEHLKNHVCNGYRQECVLIRNNLDKEVNLFFADDSPALPIGTHFTPGKGDGANYTRLSHGDYWSVK